MNREEEEERRRCVTEAIDSIPLDVDYNDGCILLTILYDIGRLPWFRFEDDSVKTDSYGRITYFCVPHLDEEVGGADFDVPYDLPPSISRLIKLQKIEIRRCRRIPVELGDLPCFTEIVFVCCDRNLFDNIPVGLQLPHLKCVCVDSPSGIPHSLAAFFNALPNCLEELHFWDSRKVEANKIISSLQDCELKFCQSLKTLDLGTSAGVDNDGFEKLLFEVLPRFPNVRNLNLSWNAIKSLRGVGKKIRELGSTSSISGTKLTEIDLRGNHISSNILIVSSECKYETTKLTKIDSVVEKSAALLLLNTFDTISNLGGMVDEQYDPDIEGALRNNLMKRSFTDAGITGTWPSNAALWPFMMEKVYNNSWQVYSSTTLPNFIKIAGEEKETRMERYRQEQITKTMNKRCATELFHMVRYGPIFAVDQCPQHEITTATTAPATKKQRTKK